MCGIVGLYLKDHALEPELGALLAGMLGTLCDRGPNSPVSRSTVPPLPARSN